MISVVRENRLLKGIKKDIEIIATMVDSNNQVIELDDVLAGMLKKMVNVVLASTIDEQAQAYPIFNGTAYLQLESVEDKAAALLKLQAQQAKLMEEIQRGEAMLANKNFTDKAPASKVAQEKEKLAEYQRQLAVVEASIKQKQN